MALSFWGKELPNVEHMLKPFTTKSWNFKRVPPQLFWSLSSGRTTTGEISALAAATIYDTIRINLGNS